MCAPRFFSILQPLPSNWSSDCKALFYQSSVTSYQVWPAQDKGQRHVRVAPPVHGPQPGPEQEEHKGKKANLFCP